MLHEDYLSSFVPITESRVEELQVCIKSTNFDVMLNIPDSNLSRQTWLRITGCTSKYSEYKQCNIKVCILMLFSRQNKTTYRSADQLVTSGFCDKLQKPSLCFCPSWVGTTITPFKILPGNRNIEQAGYRKGLGHWGLRCLNTKMSKIQILSCGNGNYNIQLSSTLS